MEPSSLKRWFGDHKDYTDDCEGNDFVTKVVRPFAADTREEAIAILRERLGYCVSIKGGKPADPMGWELKIFVWGLSIILTVSLALSVMFAIELACQVGTDRLDEIANCWFNLKWGK